MTIRAQVKGERRPLSFVLPELPLAQPSRSCHERGQMDGINSCNAFNSFIETAIYS